MSVELRPTCPADLEFVLQAEQDPENLPFVGQWPGTRHLSALTDPDLGHFIIERAADHQAVGYLILAGLCDADESVEFRRIVITHKDCGYGRAALRAVKALAFEHYRAHRLWLDVREYNQRAQQLYQSEGFLVEGKLRECTKNGDGYESLILMSMLSSE